MRAPRYSVVHRYEGFFACDSKCGVDVWDVRGRLVVMLTELSDNPGTSVTNFFERLATEILPRAMFFAVDHVSPRSVVWIEHYLRDSPSPFPETWDLVKLEWDGIGYHSPKWRRMSEENFEALLETGALVQ